jgi:hypothetical protein
VQRGMSRRFQEPSFSLPTSISSQCLYSGHLQLNLICSGIQLRNARRCCEIRPAAGTSILETLNGTDKRGLCQMAMDRRQSRAQAKTLGFQTSEKSLCLLFFSQCRAGLEGVAQPSPNECVGPRPSDNRESSQLQFAECEAGRLSMRALSRL